MSLNTAGEKCAVCKAYLFSDDDVVYCPECGAPHHRECYNSIGQCGLKEFHGTENQYKKAETQIEPEEKDTSIDLVTCGMCGEKYDKDETACPSCNAPNMSKVGGRFVTIDFLGGVPSDTVLGDNVTADDAKKFVFTNTHRYIPKFLKFNQGKKTSWNWLAFLTPCGWLLSRKMYLLGSIIGALQIAIAMLNVPFIAAVNQLDLSQAKNYMEMSGIILDNVSIIGQTVMMVSFFACALELILRFSIAIFGDFIYKNRVMSTVSHIKKNSDDIERDFRKKGGVSFIAAIIGYFAVSELPTIIAYTLGML